ncbi:enoyl-CoA hydratase/isomerase family protein [Nocardioides sp. YIM 152315]|uniref:enoyl-CoA hydratase/isomerase family protein n=1 Tax=Nocardioides sp. YIM 152315 TaxID=3031760 RepID=UPI0023DB8AF2|nr:enoyl-CoA hydratase/isomerase family protein [Nocardioides sp. YIM 152315]MDF1602224.1 enoyl-CoA hydratase/isomerase family protein [Nocardioides sp. YIM 152315]
MTDHLRDGRTPVFTRAAFARLATAAGEAERAGEVLLIVPAAPGTFCAGADLDDARRYIDQPDDYLSMIDSCWEALESGGAPIVVAVDGPAVGGAFELCLAADAVVATDRAWFSLPEATFGLPPISATRRLAAAVGRTRAREIVLSGRRVACDEARELGLVKTLCASDDLLTSAHAIAEALGKAGPHAARAIKSALSTSATDREIAREWFVRGIGGSR